MRIPFWTRWYLTVWSSFVLIFSCIDPIFRWVKMFIPCYLALNLFFWLKLVEGVPYIQKLYVKYIRAEEVFDPDQVT